MSEETGQEDLNEEQQQQQQQEEQKAEKIEMIPVAEVQGLKNTVEATRKERDELKSQYSELANQLESFKEQFGGIDVEEYKAMQEQKAQAREDAAKAGNEEAFAEYKAKAEQNQAEVQAEFEKIIRQKDEQIIQKETLLERELVRGSIKSAIMKAGGNDKTDTMIGHIVRERIAPVVQEESGSLELHVIGESGERRWTADGNNPVPLTVEDYVLEVRDAYPEAFPGSKASGTGAQGGALGKTGRLDMLERKSVTEWSPEEKDDYINERGNEAYKKQLKRTYQLAG